MKIAIFGQAFNSNTEEALVVILHYLNNREGVSVFLIAEFNEKIQEKKPSEFNFTKITDTLDPSFDLLISIGGDGTILRAVTYVHDLNIPVIGVNTGRLGFLATIQNQLIIPSLDAIFNKAYRISERHLLVIDTFPKVSAFDTYNFALNEIAVSRKNTTSMISVETRLNDEYLTSYWSDGLIVSTPTGSTGYSLSCGGPVITPDTNSLVITPISPHNLSARPLVVKDSTEVKLKVNGREDNFLVSLDSRITTLSNETIITIKKAPFTIKMIELLEESFLDTLRKKLLWGEDKRN
ncbi:NAD kinase [Bizionia argentinensis JUB59]|uniref:NAD kinase n=1 Tax=Bizionia argentinensis JUB59 TaxID=1046627 RepID=G2EFW3_9FLAO|nr:NAD kinase [Bizionia argentinensis]EGV42713.1 NAD kinase [Bizionia argentinensis JUB59]